jgi:hypothetical protein
MSDEHNGHGPSRLDRMEGLMQLLIDDHLKFSDEHNRLLTAQVILTEAQTVTERRVQELFVATKELAEQQKHTDARMDALIAVVDGLIPKRPE